MEPWKLVTIGALGTVVATVFLGGVSKITGGWLITFFGGETTTHVEERVNEYFAGEEGLLAGAVVAFDRPQECPKGWKRFTNGNDRFIVGAGDIHVLKYSNGKAVDQTGGNREITIGEPQLTKHTHVVQDSGHRHRALARHGGDERGDDRTKMLLKGLAPRERTSDQTFRVDNMYFLSQRVISEQKTGISIESEGKGQPIDITPPYVVLYLCKKEVVDSD